MAHAIEGLGAVATLAPPKTPEEIGRYQARAIAAQSAEKNALNDRKILTIGACAGLSIGLTMLLSAKSKGAQNAGAALAGAGVAAGAAAAVSHVRAQTFIDEKLTYANALAAVGASSPGIIVEKAP